MEINGKVNIFVAAFTTCLARLKLYKELDKAGEQVIYYNTDSVVTLIDDNDPTQHRPTLHDFLGGFTNELFDKKTGINHHIVEFASAGPKNYGYEREDGKRECKVKGFSLNAEGTQYLNYELLKNVLNEIQDPQYNPTTGKPVPRQHPIRRSHRIVQDPKTLEIKTVAEEKKYQMVYEKRVIEANTFKTYPYGYGDIDSQTLNDVNALLDCME